MSGGRIESELSSEAMEVHRALASLQEELEAIDFYHQRLDCTHDEQLRAMLTHTRDDEIEHAAMLLEWLRRTLPTLDGQLRKRLYTSGCISSEARSKEGVGSAPGRGLGLGNLT